MPLLQVFGKTRTSRRVFYANYLVVAAKSFLKVVEVDLEVRLTFSYVVIHQQLRVNCFNMFTKQHLEEFILQVKVVLQLVSQYISQKTQRLERLYWKVEHQYFLTEVFAASMSSIRWMIIPELFFMKQWNNKQSQQLKLVSFVP